MKKTTLLILSFTLIIIIIALYNFKYNVKEKFIITYKNAVRPLLPTLEPPTIINMSPDLASSTILLLNTKKEVAPVDLDPDQVCDDDGKICLMNFKYSFDNMSKYAYGSTP
jgi:hypothetical protein